MICTVVELLIGEGTTRIDKDWDEQLLKLEDILIVAPYNAQASALQEYLLGAQIGHGG